MTGNDEEIYKYVNINIIAQTILIKLLKDKFIKRNNQWLKVTGMTLVISLNIFYSTEMDWVG